MMSLKSFSTTNRTYKTAALLVAVTLNASLAVAQPTLGSFRLTSASGVSRLAESVAGTEHSIRYFGSTPQDQRVAISAQGEPSGTYNNVGAVYLTPVDGLDSVASSNNPNIVTFSGSAAMEYYGSAIATIMGSTAPTSDILAIGASGFKVNNVTHGKVDFKDPFNTGIGDYSFNGPTANGGFGKYLSQPPGAIWSVTRGPLPELLVSAIGEKRLYFLNLSNGYAGLNTTTTRYASLPSPIPTGMAIPSLKFGAKAVKVDIIGDPTEDLVVCDPNASIDGVAYIYDGSDVAAYLGGSPQSHPTLHPTSQIAPDTSTLYRANNQSLWFCNDAAVVKDSTGSQVLFIGAPQSRSIPNTLFYEGAVVAYRKGATNSPTIIGTSFGELEGVHFGHKVASTMRTNLTVGAPKQTTLSTAIASIKVFDVSFADSPAGFVASMESPILERTQQTSGPEAAQEVFLGQALTSSRNPPGQFGAIVSAGSPTNGGTQMAKGFSDPNLGFVSIGGDNPLCSEAGSTPSRLNATRDPTTGDITFSVEPHGPSVLAAGVAIYFGDPSISPRNLVLPVTDPNCTIPFMVGLVGIAPTTFTLPVSAITGIEAFAIGIVMDLSTGRILTTNAVSFNGDSKPY